MAKTKKAAFSRTSKNIPGHLKHSQICQEFPGCGHHDVQKRNPLAYPNKTGR